MKIPRTKYLALSNLETVISDLELAKELSENDNGIFWDDHSWNAMIELLEQAKEYIELEMK